ncbi:MAG: hypothetical protein PHT72_02915 [Candidatus Absconditabacteria bacterium]|nr:hypothetical protein [Candidatus Absconditabacteria bacterium]
MAKYIEKEENVNRKKDKQKSLCLFDYKDLGRDKQARNSQARKKPDFYQA